MAFLPFSLLVSCYRPETEEFIPVMSAKKSVSDTSSFVSGILRGYEDADDRGTVAVFGGTEETAVIAESMMTADMFDNIDGKPVCDSLPDFAGEVIMPVFDVVNAPYQGYIDAMNDDFARESLLEGFLACISDRCSSTAFDYSMSEPKPAAKVVILSSSVAASYGCEDIRYVLDAFDKNTGVLNTVESSLSYLFDKTFSESNFGVWASSDIISSGVYGNVFNRMRSRHADRQSDEYAEWAKSAEIVCLSPDTEGTAYEKVKRFLDLYASAGYSTPLAGVVIDDPASVREVDSLNIAADSIMSSVSPEDVQYAGLMQSGFEFVSPVITLTRDCYRWLRENGRFTHLVAPPDMAGYMTVPSSEVSGKSLDGKGSLVPDFKYNRAADSDVRTYRFVPVSQSCFPPETAERLRQIAPVTYKRLFYVY